ncbi:DUF2933 domain-containing protein [Schinkia azotoformans]|uniref:DUF2933 domain-containing protein n=1 Tax=Schinkia azotoformans TaxID=1454 RepID=UPI002DBA07D8|nr:DUF2933 domain-containing protein [Schinkia azotoformans]MEC1742795.1 DUF2933 domain-containing protein [Schinkia azotoformans]MEC1769032.1 DUF2933 domain-containing protein [Schinkia azotoformans]MEC1789617.1 DUF2933 domain-containing protein [Schinkia azotoformans]MED4378442.1 DUF2933 domain-containing protein [Schinkia azotoformans]MED4417415.1 DUF2933 domain-containing protein [Schinkia azotoformans]
MEWLLLLLCPLMMIFCMRGHGGKGHNHSHESHSVDAHKMHSMDQYKMNELMGKVDLLTEQNHQLKEELQALKSEKEKNIVS